MTISKAKFELHDVDVERIQNAILNVGPTSENVINDYLHSTGGGQIVKGITNLIPRSKFGTHHARDNNWSEQTNYNLAVDISNSLKGKRGTSFYYLYYVVTGTGTSKKIGPRDFMSEGMNREYDNVVNGLFDAINENIEREMN